MSKSFCLPLQVRTLLPLILAVNVLVSDRSLGAAGETDGKLRIIAFGAHPDDCEIKAGGVAAMWAQAGHHVKFVSLTNGDIGH